MQRRATHETMIVLDKSRALDLMISRAERIQVPPPFGADFTPASPDGQRITVDEAALGLTNLLDVRARRLIGARSAA